MMIFDREQLVHITDLLQRDGDLIVLTSGCYDLLHWGHLKHLRSIKPVIRRRENREQITLIVGVNTDISVKDYKGRLPLQDELDRMALVDSLPDVDIVCPLPELEPSALIRAVAPDYFVKGPPWGDLDKLPELGALQEVECIFLYLETMGNTRSSEIRKRLEKE